jgi:hypothetical protein
MESKIMRAWFYFVIVSLLLCLSSSAIGQQPNPFGDYRTGRDAYRTPTGLIVPQATLDPTSGDLLMLSNAWPNVPIDLRRFHSDGTPVTSFVLQRFESCCALHPSLVAADSKGSVYDLEFIDQLKGFYLYKHAPNGQLDIGWGYADKPTSSVSSGAYGGSASGTSSTSPEKTPKKAITTLGGNAGGGRMDLHFANPVDMIPRSDGSILILDQATRIVYAIDPAGQTIATFLGYGDYTPINPMRLFQDKGGNLYIVDFYDQLDLFRKGMVGLFKFNPDGSWVKGWGESTGSINDSGRPTIDFRTLAIDGQGIMMILGGDPSNANHGEMYTYDLATGAQLSDNYMEYMAGPDTGFLGVVGNLKSGMVLLQARDWTVLVNYYSTDGKRQAQVQIKDLYPAE